MEEFSVDIINQARVIAGRSKFWTSDIEKLLRRWRKQINSRHFEHKEAERKYTKFYYLLGVPTTILSTVVSSGILTTFQNCNICTSQCSPDASSLCSGDVYIRLAMGILGVVAVVLTATSLFLNYGASSVDNKNASDAYGELVREIDSIVETPIISRGDPIVSLHQIRTKFDDIAKKSPSLTSKISLEYKTVKSDSPLVRAATQKTKMPDASSLAKILVDKIEAESENNIKTLKKIAESNDYNTDEEREVAIALDIERVRPGDTMESTKRNAMEESLAKALEFELSRFYIPEEKKDKIETKPIRRKKKKHVVVDIVPVEDIPEKEKDEVYL